MKVSVCIAATRADTVGATVRSIVEQTHRDWELLVIAQGPRAAQIATVVDAALRGRDGRVIQQRCWGLSRARNTAVRAASGELIAMTDDDCEAAPDWLDALIAALRASPTAGVLGGPLLPPPRSRRGPGVCPACSPSDVLWAPGRFAQDSPPGFSVVGGNLAFLRRTAEMVGPFDEYLGPGAYFPVADDIDFVRRAARLGIPLRSSATAVVHHTSGWRYGMRAVAKIHRNYALGNGGHAGKITLLGDAGGAAALHDMRRMAARDWLTRRRAAALPAGISRYHYFVTAYRDCLRRFVVDAQGLLRAKARDKSELRARAASASGADFPSVVEARRYPRQTPRTQRSGSAKQPAHKCRTYVAQDL